MQWMGLNEIREKYLAYFESKGHLRLPSFPLVPQGDNSLLLINSGMAPMKPYFTGQVTPPSKRVTTCQKCIRTPDIERVGKTSRHGTFFEMLGNFSFGDYFKEEATTWAWEFCTEVMKLPKDKLYVSYYHDDLEALEIWRDRRGVAPDHLVPLGKADNFWEIGTGPCGPCSEIYFDRGEEHGCDSPDCAVGCDCDRYVEFWNLVFTQFDSDGKGNYSKLAKPNIDTGMGLERLACIMQGVSNLFEVDTVKNVLDAAAGYAGIKYGADASKDVSLRVIADHIRGTTFLISDGVLPGNEGRGYVLRRLLRRASRHGKLLGINKKFLSELCDIIINDSSAAYPELAEKRDYIKKVILMEEERFDSTIDQGLAILNDHIADIKQGSGMLPGEEAFKLYDTFGFPIDLTREILEEQGLTFDEKGFDALMKQQKERARAARSAMGDLGWTESVLDSLDKNVKTEFVGYSENECKADIYAIVVDGQLVQGAQEGEDVTVILNKTPFYAESGGQVGDTGEITKAGAVIAVADCKKSIDGKYLHFGKVIKGSFITGEQVTANIDADRRAAIKRNHSSAHLLQAALRKVLGSHVEQAGSYVDAERVRFDFSHFAAMTSQEVADVEALVNKMILEGAPVDVAEMSIDKAKEMGAMALFGEKYGSVVRVVKMQDFSTELCGGTHVDNTAKIGLFKVLTESSVAAGVRRIEGTTGMNIISLIDQKQQLIADTAEILKAGGTDIDKKARALSEAMKQQQKEIESFKAKLAGGKIDELMAKAEAVGDIKLLAVRLEGTAADELRSLGDGLKDRFEDIAAVLAGVSDGKANLCVIFGKQAVEKGLNAGAVAGASAKIAGGGGGGRPDSAMAGCKDLSKLDEALAHAKQMINEKL